MNPFPVIRTTSINLWTLGHRRYYSPIIRVAGGLSALGAVLPCCVRADPGLRREPDPAGNGAAEHAAPAEKRHHVF
jgi:hypothetical protein